MIPAMLRGGVPYITHSPLQSMPVLTGGGRVFLFLSFRKSTEQAEQAKTQLKYEINDAKCYVAREVWSHSLLSLTRF